MRALALLPFLLAFTLYAQDTPTLNLSTNLVLVPTEVQTKTGETLYALKPEQFVLEDNGIPQKIRVDQDTDTLGLSLVVVMQCSREAFKQFNNMRGLTAMIDDLAGGAPRQVAVVSYGSEPVLIGTFSSDPATLASNLAQVEPCEDDKAVTLDAVAFANHLFDSEPATNLASPAARNRRAILLISETRDFGSHAKPERVLADLGRSNTVVDAVSFNPGKTSIVDSIVHGKFGPGYYGLLVMAVEALRKNVPHTLAELSGGEYTNFTTKQGFDAGLQRLTNHIHNFYLISFAPPADNAPGLHRLQVKIPDYPDAHIRSRLTYYSGEAPPDLPDPKADKKQK